MAGCNIPRTNNNPIFKSAVEGVIRDISRGVILKLTGTRHGFSYDHLQNMIANDNREQFYGTPRCQRLRLWDTEKRLKQLEQIEGENNQS